MTKALRTRVLAAACAPLILALTATAFGDHGQTAGASTRPRAHRPPPVRTIDWTPAVQTGLSTALPPWPLPGDARFDIANADLSPQAGEVTKVHYHAHLDIIDAGQPVTVPADVGFVLRNGTPLALTFLHTHDTTGVVHVEAPSMKPYALGQFLTEWGVSVGPDHLGGLTTGNGNVLRTFVNGKEFHGNPGTIVLAPHQEIAIWYGPASETPHVPTSYHFAKGL